LVAHEHALVPRRRRHRRRRHLDQHPADTTRAIAQLHYSNTFARTPDVTYIAVLLEMMIATGPSR
jgi:hypothetical protein